jgi:hypothetical protein
LFVRVSWLKQGVFTSWMDFSNAKSTTALEIRLRNCVDGRLE